MLLEVSAVVSNHCFLLDELHSLIGHVCVAGRQLCFLRLCIHLLSHVVLRTGFHHEHAHVALDRFAEHVLALCNGLTDDSRLHTGVAETAVSQRHALYALYGLTEVNDGEYRPMESVRAELTYEATNNAKAEYIKKQLKGVQSLEAAAEILGQSVQSAERVSLADSRFGNAGMEPAVIGKALAMGENALSEPIQGNMGVFMIKTGAKNNLAEEMNAEVEKAQIMARYAYLPYQAMQLIEEKAEVTDNRANFQ